MTCPSIPDPVRRVHLKTALATVTTAAIAFAAPSLAQATITDNLRPTIAADGNTPLCDFLQSRRGGGSSLGARGSA